MEENDDAAGRGREWQDVALKFEGTWETRVNAHNREEAVRIAKRTLMEKLEPIGASIKVRDDICYVCGEPAEPDAEKYDPKKPVYDTIGGGVYHLGCEDEVFEEIHCSLRTDN